MPDKLTPADHRFILPDFEGHPVEDSSQAFGGKVKRLHPAASNGTEEFFLVQAQVQSVDHKGNATIERIHKWSVLDALPVDADVAEDMWNDLTLEYEEDAERLRVLRREANGEPELFDDPVTDDRHLENIHLETGLIVE